MNEDEKKQQEYVLMTKKILEELKSRRTKEILKLIGFICLIAIGIKLLVSAGAAHGLIETVAELAMVVSGSMITVILIPRIFRAHSAVQAAEESLALFLNGRVSAEDYEKKYLDEMISFVGTSKEALQMEERQLENPEYYKNEYH